MQPTTPEPRKNAKRRASTPRLKPTAAIEPLMHSPTLAALRLGIPERAVYVLIETGALRSLKIGRRRLIPDTECTALMQRKLAEAT